MVKPGGTGRPMTVISARFAPLPPSRSAIARLPSLKSYTYLVIRRSFPDGSGGGLCVVTTPPAQPPQLVGTPDDDREDDEECERARRWHRGAEDVFQCRHGDQCGGEDDLEGNAPQQQLVAERPDGAQGGVLGAGGEGGADLAGDDAEEGHGGGLQPDVVQRRARV